MVDVSSFIHPDDAAALNTLKNVPYLSTVMEKVMQYGYEEISYSENITTNIRLSEKQMPEIYKHLPPICEKLGIPVPELYLQLSPIPNAWTSGNTRVYIVITFGLVRRLTDEEFDAVLAHECGHILCQHVLYSMLANAIFSLGDAMMDSLLGQVGNVAMKPIKQALFTWSRASELSADRVGSMIAGPNAMISALAKLERIPRSMFEQFNFDSWIEQGRDYERMKNGSAWSKVVRYMSNMDMDHPFSPVRAYEIRKWEETKKDPLTTSMANDALSFQTDYIEELMRLKELKELGILTEEEFGAEKTKLLNK